MKNQWSRSLLLVAVLVTVTACSRDEDGGGHELHDNMELPAGEAISGQSVYQLESAWISQRDETIRLQAFAGKPVVLAMVYTHCDHACPRIIGDMRLIRKELHAHEKDVHFVLVSIDPERDTVGRLKAFGEETGLTKQGWILLRSDETDLRELAAVFGVQYRRTSETDFAHSNIINVLNRKGEIVHQQEGLGSRPDESVRALKLLLDENAG